MPSQTFGCAFLMPVIGTLAIVEMCFLLPVAMITNEPFLDVWHLTEIPSLASAGMASWSLPSFCYGIKYGILLYDLIPSICEMYFEARPPVCFGKLAPGTSDICMAF